MEKIYPNISWEECAPIFLGKIYPFFCKSIPQLFWKNIPQFFWKNIPQLFSLENGFTFAAVEYDTF